MYNKSARVNCVSGNFLETWKVKTHEEVRSLTTGKSKVRDLAIHCDLFGMVKWPVWRLSDLQLGDKKATLNHLVREIFFQKGRVGWLYLCHIISYHIVSYRIVSYHRIVYMYPSTYTSWGCSPYSLVFTSHLKYFWVGKTYRFKKTKGGWRVYDSQLPTFEALRSLRAFYYWQGGAVVKCFKPATMFVFLL